MHATRTIAMAAVLTGLLLPASVAGQTGLRDPDPTNHQLKMEFVESELRVSNGTPFDPCAILLGLAERKTTLPGGRR